MRTTLTIDDDVLDTARSIAEFRKISVGEALSELARRGANPPISLRLDPDTGFLIPDFPENPILSNDDVRRLIEQTDAEEDEKYLKYFQPQPTPKGAQIETPVDGRDAANHKS